MWLTNREKEILKLTIGIYIETGYPVSSRRVSKKRKNYFSPATIRNEMLSLEEKGYLYQTHSQSGRIPTPKAIKYYLKYLIREEDISLPELKFNSFSNESTEFKNFWKSVSENLSFVSQNIGFIISPSFFSVNFKEIKFLNIGNKRALIILETPGNLVATKVINTEDEVSQRQLDKFSTYINTNYRGKSLDYVLKNIYINSRKEQMKLLSFISFLKKYIIKKDNDFDFYFNGEEKLLEKSLNRNIKEIKHVVELLENREKLVKLLQKAKNEGQVNIFFSPLIGNTKYEDLTLFVSNYYCNNEIQGKVGVLGFNKLDYPLIYSLVKEAAKSISSLLNEKTNS